MAMAFGKRLISFFCGMSLLSPTALYCINIEKKIDGLRRFHVAHYQDEHAFGNKVSTYVTQICSKQQAELHAIFGAIESVHKNIEYDDLKDVLNKVAQVHASLGSDTDEFEEFRCALLLKASIPFSEYVRKAILHTLNHLDNQIKYWECQKGHPVSYFFHKSPLKWFSKANQMKEIISNLRQLRRVQKEHCKMLGILMVHLDSFKNEASTAEQYQWLAQLLSIIHQLCMEKGLEPQDIANYDALFPLMQRLLDQTEAHQDKICDYVIADAQKPNHFVRNWLTYTTAGIGALATWRWYRNPLNSQKITRLSSNFYEQVVSGPVKGVREVFKEDERGNAKDRVEKLVKEAGKIIKDPVLLGRLDAFQKIVKDVWPNLKPDGNYVYYFLRDKLWSQAKRDAVEKGFNDLEELVDEVLEDFKDYASTIIGDSSEIKDKINNILDKGEEISDKVLGLYRQLKVFAAILRLVPLGVLITGAGTVLYKTYKKLRKPNYEPIRTTLVDIAHLLNCYEDAHSEQMEPEDYGKLLYLGYRLKKEKYEVPAEKRYRFVADINKLLGNQLSANKKRNVVDLMYKRYDFLAPTYNG